MPGDELNLMLVLKKKENIQKLEQILEKQGYKVLGSFTSGVQALRYIIDIEIDIAVVSSNLSDNSSDTIVSELSENYHCDIIYIVPQEYLASSSGQKSKDVTYLPRPITPELLLSTIETIARYRRKVKRLNNDINDYKKALEKRVYGERAKAILMDKEGMSENDAWRYIQKKSMDTCRPLIDVAKEIIALYEKKSL